MTTEEIQIAKYKVIRSIGKPFLYLQYLALATMFSFPFLCIWSSWSISWRVGLSGLILFVISHWISNLIRKIISEAIDKHTKAESSGSGSV